MWQESWIEFLGEPEEKMTGDLRIRVLFRGTNAPEEQKPWEVVLESYQTGSITINKPMGIFYLFLVAIVFERVLRLLVLVERVFGLVRFIGHSAA